MWYGLEVDVRLTYSFLVFFFSFFSFINCSRVFLKVNKWTLSFKLLSLRAHYILVSISIIFSIACLFPPPITFICCNIHIFSPFLLTFLVLRAYCLEKWYHYVSKYVRLVLPSKIASCGIFVLFIQWKAVSRVKSESVIDGMVWADEVEGL